MLNILSEKKIKVFIQYGKKVENSNLLQWGKQQRPFKVLISHMVQLTTWTLKCWSWVCFQGFLQLDKWSLCLLCRYSFVSNTSQTPPTLKAFRGIFSVGLLNWNSFLYIHQVCVCASSQSCLTLRDPMDCSLPISSVHGIVQARILQWVAISFSRGSSWPRDQTHFSLHCRWIPYHWATWEAHIPQMPFLVTPKSSRGDISCMAGRYKLALTLRTQGKRVPASPSRPSLTLLHLHVALKDRSYCLIESWQLQLNTKKSACSSANDILPAKLHKCTCALAAIKGRGGASRALGGRRGVGGCSDWHALCYI